MVELAPPLERIDQACRSSLRRSRRRREQARRRRNLRRLVWVVVGVLVVLAGLWLSAASGSQAPDRHRPPAVPTASLQTQPLFLYLRQLARDQARADARSPLTGGGFAAVVPRRPPQRRAASIPFQALILQSAARHRLDPALLAGLIRQESNFNPHATSPAGAAGLAQLMPQTAQELGVADPYDPAASIEAGARYLRRQLDRLGDVRLALAAYNAGPGAVRRHRGIPPYPETRDYVQKVLAHTDRYRCPAGRPSRDSSCS